MKPISNAHLMPDDRVASGRKTLTVIADSSKLKAQSHWIESILLERL
ncbi:hypothetical protein D1BOALGB6SA_113 [Olavius sp. associated proteobacterium Delta 1]|nr:hypothetical protein D1BOALGB6SA_113 [Olavius sp. associated proteobacterium Delta 1]